MYIPANGNWSKDIGKEAEYGETPHHRQKVGWNINGWVDAMQDEAEPPVHRSVFA
jgi:hypothetical protein